MAIKEDILGGLKLAISKGDSLKQAMQSFYNAGYKKEDIENAARTMQMEEHARQKRIISQRQNSSMQLPEKKSFFSKINLFKKKDIKTSQKKYPEQKNKQTLPSQKIIIPQNKQASTIKPIQPLKQKEEQKPIKPIQKVSGYGHISIKPKKDIIAIILIITLLILSGVLTGIYFFKEELAQFFGKLFSNV